MCKDQLKNAFGGTARMLSAMTVRRVEARGLREERNEKKNKGVESVLKVRDQS